MTVGWVVQWWIRAKWPQSRAMNTKAKGRQQVERKDATLPCLAHSCFCRMEKSLAASSPALVFLLLLRIRPSLSLLLKLQMWFLSITQKAAGATG